MNLKLWLIVILIGIFSLTGLAGCNVTRAAESTATPTPPAITSPPVSSNSTPIINVNNPQGIWVTGQGTVMVSPNIATLSVGVTVQADKVADAQSQAAAAMAKVMAALTNNGVDPKDISTQYYSINQLTQFNNTTQQTTITGYQVSNLVNVTIRVINNTGTIIDAVTAAGGDATRINGINFTVDDVTSYNSQARTLAVNDAKAKADQLASLAGITLGQPFYLIENPPATPIPISAPVASAATGTTTPISPGQINVTITVQVAYGIQ
jgi:uncharacterized protein